MPPGMVSTWNSCKNRQPGVEISKPMRVTPEQSQILNEYFQ